LIIKEKEIMAKIEAPTLDQTPVLEPEMELPFVEETLAPVEEALVANIEFFEAEEYYNIVPSDWDIKRLDADNIEAVNLQNEKFVGSRKRFSEILRG
jgi:hypothetical protein